LLSPQVHQTAWLAAEKLGDADRAKVERCVTRACLRGLVRSGDGSPDRPFPVTHISDEYDLLDHLGKEFRGQRNVTTEAGGVDGFDCGDGSDLWFDVTLGAKSGL